MKIEEKLKLADSKDGKSSLLWAQWKFDKEIVSRSLNSISNSFPHYSLHESSHSASILSEIEKLLGEKVGALSYVDCWLLLEAVYWHDAGMIITFDQKKALVSDAEFLKFIEISKNDKGGLSKYADVFSAFLKGDFGVEFIEAEKAFTFLLAEYIRKIHPARSRQALENPDDIGINAPRTGLINARLYSLLGDIIECHGSGFESILKLPFDNDGLEAGDIAHPRFIACMLRIGDLLDLDDGRHCPTLLKSIGALPVASQAHLEKHRSIISKTVNPFVLEIRAECSTFEAFEAQNDWLSWLEKEVENQDKHWGEIAPEKTFGKLPTIRSLSCEMIGHIPVFSRASRLSIDADRMYGYLNGNYIYKNPLAGIGEILQNAVDATLKRLWAERKTEITDLQSFRNIARKHPIKIDVSLTMDDSTNLIVYHVSVRDSGIGMGISDIRSLATIASKTRHQEHLRFSFDMPEWMRPSGYFGIGIQSVFSMADKLTISTKSPSDKGYDVIIRTSPGKTPSITVKENLSGAWDFGTIVKFDLTDVAIPDRFSGRSMVSRGIAEFDPLQDTILRIKEFQLEEQAREFAKYSDFPIEFKNSVLPSLSNLFSIVDVDEGIEYSVEFHTNPHQCKWAFRGRPFESNFNFKFFAIRGNIISGYADQFLSLDREELHDSGRVLLRQKIERSLKSKREEILKSVSNKCIASLYYHFIGEDVDDSWRELEVSGVKLRDCLVDGAVFDFAVHAEHYMSIPEDENVKVLKSNQSLFVDVLAKEGKGIKISDIRYVSAENVPFNGSGQMLQIFRVTVLPSTNESSVSETAYKILSGEKLKSTRLRCWVPCEVNAFSGISIDVQKIDGWIVPITPFYALFKRGILIPNSRNDIQKDVCFLAKWLNENREPKSAREIEIELNSFMEKFPFEYADASTFSIWDW